MLSFIEPVCKKVCTDALYEYFGNKFWPEMLIKEVPKVLTNWEQLLAYASAIDPKLAAAVSAGVFVVGGIIYKVTHQDGNAVVEPVAVTETKTQHDSEEEVAAVDVDAQTKEFEKQLEQELAEQQEAARKLAEQQEVARKLAEQQEAARKLAEQQEAARKLAEQQEAARKLAEQQEVARKLAEQQEVAERKAQETKQVKLQRTLKAAREKAELKELTKPQGAAAAVNPLTAVKDFAQQMHEASVALAKEQELKREQEREANEARQKVLDAAPLVERKEAATFEARREEAKVVFKADVERKKTRVQAAPAPVAVDEQMYHVEVTPNTFVSAYLSHCQNPLLKVKAKTQRQQVTNEILNGFGIVNGQIPASRVPAFNAELDRLELGQFKVVPK